MRCLNCHTVLMPNDTHCPMCRMATSAGVAEQGEMSLGARLLWSLASFVIGGILILVGISTYNSEFKPARKVTAADLLKIKDIDEVPDDDRWIVYEPKAVKEGGVIVVRSRSHQTESRFMIVAVGSRWMMAQVGPNMNGYHLDGKLEEWDNEMLRDAMGRLRRLHQHETSRLVPFQMNAETGKPTYDPKKVGPILGVVGVFGLLFGVAFLLGARKSG